MGLKGITRMIVVLVVALITARLAAQPCNNGYTFTASPPPTGGVYQSGQAVTFCYTVTNWTIVNVNWFHGISIAPGPGWDMSTLAPGPPPPTCGALGGTWGWYASCDGTSPTALPPVGPGYFFDLDDDGNPGNNFGDLCSGAVNWQFCWTITTVSGGACVNGMNANMVVNSYGDSETGAWGSSACGGDAIATLPATLNCCSANAGTSGSVALCSTNAPVNLLTYLGGTPDASGTWTAPGGGATMPVVDPATSAAGAYTYTVTSGNCSSSAVVNVAIAQPPDAGADGVLAICSNNTPTNLNTIITGAQAGGTWTGPGNVPFSGIYDPAINASGVFTYTITGTAPCLNDQSTVVVTETAPPFAGTDGATTVCANGTPFDLSALLGGGPTTGGTWTTPGGGSATNTYTPGTSAPGAYTYTVTGTAPCVSDQATVTVVQNDPVNAGLDAATTVCADGAAVDLFTLLTGAPDVGGTWTEPGGGATTSTYIPGTSTAGVYTYTVVAVAPCVNDQATVTVVQNDPVNAGLDAATTVCADGAAIDLFTLLTGAPDVGGTWTAPGGGAATSTYTPGTSAAGVYTYTVVAAAPCVNDQATVTVVQNDPVNAGLDAATTVCADGAAIDLFTLLTGAPDVGGTWSAPGGGASTSTYTPGTSTAGVYTYTVVAAAPCLNDQATVTVVQNDPVDAGMDGAATLCITSPAIALLAELGGTPDLGGTWTGPGGAASSGTFTPGTSTPGVYTYSVLGNAPCPSDQAAVTVTVTSLPDPGTNGDLALCADAAPIDLFTALGGSPDAGGTWTGPDGAMVIMPFDPAVNTAGVYTYTITVPPPCLSVSSTVTVTIQQPPNAGTNGALTLCISGGATPLITALGGGPDGGGTWTAPGGGAFNGTFIPGTSAGGAYTYTVLGPAPCANASSTVSVAVTSEPDPGLNGALLLCMSGAPEDLFAALGGTPDAGGSWTGPGGAPHDATFDPAVDVAGGYTYTLAVPPPCSSASSTVTVLLQLPPNAGTDGSITLCSTSASTALFSQLGGSPNPGGSWTVPGGGAFNGSFIPGTSESGIYTYTVNGVSPCPNSSADVVVAVNAPPNAGGDGTLTLCSTGATVALFPALTGTPEVGGAWTSPGGTSHGTSFDPGTDAPGSYTYTVAGMAPCPNDQAVVTVGVIPPPDTGINGSVSLCSSGAATGLFALLGGAPTAGGSWTDPGGAPMNGTIDPANAVNGAYTYLVSGTAPCPAASSQINVSITPAADAGQNGAVLLCASSPLTVLFPHLIGTPDAGGSWTAPGGGASDGLFDPAIGSAGLYSYTVQGAPPCPNATATVLVNVTSSPDAGQPGDAALCMSDDAIALLDILDGTPDAGGYWTGPGGAPHTGTMDPATDPAGTYTYTINVPPPCVSASSSVDIALVSPSDPGVDGTLSLCAGDAPAALFDQLGGTPEAGGAWTVNGNAHSGNFDPNVDGAGTFTYTVQSDAPCPAQTADVVVLVTTPPDPGTNGTVVACISGDPIDLFAELGGTPATGGMWTYLGGGHSGHFVPGVDVAGDYVYTLPGVAPCPDASSMVSVTVVSSPNAGIDGSLTVCSSGNAVDLFGQLGGGPDAGGTWSGPSTVVNGAFDPATMLAGNYTYSIDAPAPCPSSSGHVLVTLVEPADPGSAGSMALCISSPATNLFLQLNGTPDAGGAWTDPMGQPHGPLFNPASDPSGDYTYTLPGNSPCPSASAVVTMNVVSNPDPGANSAITRCLSDEPFDLFSTLGGTPDVGGSWTGPSYTDDGLFDPGTMAPGTYTYLIDVPPPCVSVSSTVTIALTTPPVAGLDGNALLCISSPVAQLSDHLDGSPQPGGTWFNADGVPFSGSFTPGVDQAGTFTYVVQGDWPCPADSALVTISVVEVADPGGNGALTLCQSDDGQDLFSLLEGDQDEGGTWSGPSPITNGMFDPGTMATGIYTYLLNAPAPCPDTSSTVTVTVVAPADAGADGANTLCAASDPFDLFAALGGSPQPGGLWMAPGGAPHSNTFTPGVDGAGTYVYTVAGTAPCPAVAASVNVAVIQPPQAGGDGQVILCFGAPPVELFPALSSDPDAGGSWTAPGGAQNTGTMDPAIDAEGMYTYTVSGAAPCPNDQALVEVIVGDPINATVVTTDAVCHDACDGTASLTIAGGTPGFTMQWSGNVAGTSALSASGLCAGEYGVTVTDAGGCTGSTSYVITEPEALTIAQISTTDENCIGSCDGSVTVADAAGVLFSIDGGSIWSPSATMDELCAGGHVVMMQDANGCVASAIVSIMSPAPVVAGFYASPDTMNVSNTLVVFTNQTGNAETFVWDFAGLGSSTEGNPSFTFPDVLGGTYMVCLAAINSNGCADTICQPVVVLDELLVTIPNAFTPNGDDMNDGFCPVFNDPAIALDYSFMIFDRWGLLIFESTTIHEKWYAQLNSVDVPEDVYVWKMYCRDIITKEVYDRIGHVTVVR